MPEKAPAIPEKGNAALDVFQNKRNALDVEASLSTSSTEEWIQTKLAGILTADSFDAINNLMTQTGLTPAKTLIGRTFEIQDFGLSESAGEFRANSQLQKYCLVKAVDVSSGEEFIVDGGGDQFVAGLVRMRDLYGFPYTGTLLSTTTQAGFELHYWRFHDPKRAKLNADA